MKTIRAVLAFAKQASYNVFCAVIGLLLAGAIILSSKRGRWKWFQAMMGG